MHWLGRWTEISELPDRRLVGFWCVEASLSEDLSGAWSVCARGVDSFTTALGVGSVTAMNMEGCRCDCLAFALLNGASAAAPIEFASEQLGLD